MESKTLAVLVFMKAENMNHIMECRDDGISVFMLLKQQFKVWHALETPVWEFINPSWNGMQGNIA